MNIDISLREVCTSFGRKSFRVCALLMKFAFRQVRTNKKASIILLGIAILMLLVKVMRRNRQRREQIKRENFPPNRTGFQTSSEESEPEECAKQQPTKYGTDIDTDRPAESPIERKRDEFFYNVIRQSKE